jgi:hypothetical protein
MQTASGSLDVVGKLLPTPAARPRADRLDQRVILDFPNFNQTRNMMKGTNIMHSSVATLFMYDDVKAGKRPTAPDEPSHVPESSPA